MPATVLLQTYIEVNFPFYLIIFIKLGAATWYSAEQIYCFIQGTDANIEVSQIYIQDVIKLVIRIWKNRHKSYGEWVIFFHNMNVFQENNRLDRNLVLSCQCMVQEVYKLYSSKCERILLSGKSKSTKIKRGVKKSC